MFYQTGIDITNDKQMFNFLKNHFEYNTLNSWNRLTSIANNVKLYRLGLTGDWCVAMDLLNAGEYEEINMMIREWERENRGYQVGFNGRSGGYLVLMNEKDATHILPEIITDAENYEEYKNDCRDLWGSVKANRSDLVYYTKLVQSFDKLCDQLLDYCDGLSRQTFEYLEMQKAVEVFNEEYGNDLEYLNFDYLRCEDDGSVDLSEILALNSLTEAFFRVADRSEYNYSLEWRETNKICLMKM